MKTATTNQNQPKKPSLTKVVKTLQKYASNQAYILQVVNLSEFEYNNLLFEFGCKFLEELYPKGTPHYEYYTKFSRDVMFWKWWKAEFKQWEDELLGHVAIMKAKLTPQLYFDEMLGVVGDPVVYQNFVKIYLKRLAKHEV